MLSMSDNWRELFERGRVIPPHSQTVRQAEEAHLTKSQGFQILINRVTGPHLQQRAEELSAAERSVTYQLRVTLFDRSHQHFFGKTWKSSHQRKTSKQNILFNEIVYFHTSLRLPGILAVLELVELSDGPDGSQHALGRGFTILELFPSKGEARSHNGDRRLILHHGSPRLLLNPLVKDAEYGSLLKAIDGAHLDCALKGHPALVSMMHLLPEYMLASGDNNIPGLLPSPTGDALQRPQLLKMQAYTLSQLTISLHPSLDIFESQLLQHVSADWQSTKQPGMEVTPRLVAIQERRLHVGVHNGWCFLDKPQVVVLELQTSASKGRVDDTSKQGTLAKDRKAMASLTGILGLRSSLELQLANHKALAVVFQLEYVFSAPVGQENRLSATSTSRAAFMQCLRWGHWCPFQESSNLEEVDIQLTLLGGASPNPYGVLVYRSSPSPEGLSPQSSSAAPSNTQKTDILRFRLKSSSDRKASSPKAFGSTKQQRDMQRQRRSMLSPEPQGRKVATNATPPPSPPGQALSLSQLAVTSPYPTISRSAAALPWQQPFSPPLDPSPLASAHQLSHVGSPAACDIADLEMDLQRRGDASPPAHSDGEHLQELPFTPVHAPVITLGVKVPSSPPVSSRHSLAHLYSAGFPEILDRDGHAAEALDPTESMHFDPQREEADVLQGNLLVFQFLAFSRVSVTDVDPDWPENIHFTFQFYRFPPVTSQRLKLLTASKAQRRVSDPLPCVLASINNDGTLNSGPPGLHVQYRVNETVLKPGERRWFLRYLAQQTLQVDVWDSDSLLLVGSSCIQLQCMLRQCRPAVQALHQVEVLTTEYTSQDAPGQHQGGGTKDSLVNVHTVLRGWLHVRTGNIGCPEDSVRRRTGALPTPGSHVITPRDAGGGSNGFRGGSLSTRSIHRLKERNATLAQRPVEIDGGFAAPFQSRIKNTVVPGLDGRSLGESAEDRQRKLSCLAAVLQREGEEDPESQVKAAKVMGRREERAQLVRDLRQIKAYQDRSKAEGIANMLSQAITTRHVVYASLGTAEYMEFVLRNPFNVPQTVTVHSGDPELSVITNTEEWRHFKTLTRTATPLEQNLFQVEEGAPGPRLYLRPKESVHIPLKYQTFFCDHSAILQGPGVPPAGRQDDEIARKHPSNVVRAKSIKVTFKAEDDTPMAILQVDVEPTPHVVEHTIRLYHPQLCLLKKALRMSHWHTTAAGLSDEGEDVSVRCSDPNVICQTKTLAPGEPQDVYLKVPGSSSPTLKMFYVMVFIDEWLAVPAYIWRIYVHFLERMDISCVAGQRCCQSLVLRGTQAVRKLKCFSSHPREVEVDPAGVFVLPPAGAVQELRAQVQPRRSGSRLVFINAVDVERRQLVAGWMLCLNVHGPVLSKAFEVCVPVGGGRGSTRRITYTNPYTSSRQFLLHTDRPDLLQFKEDRFQIGGEEMYTIGLRFAPSQSSGSAEILVYVNDPDEKTEETFCVKVNYS